MLDENWKIIISEGIINHKDKFVNAVAHLLSGEEFTPLGLAKKVNCNYCEAVAILDLLNEAGLTNHCGFFWGEDEESSKPIKLITCNAEKAEIYLYCWDDFKKLKKITN